VVKTVAIVQARTGSSRLPGKVMARIGDVPMLGVLLSRLSLARNVDEIVVATPDLRADDVISAYVGDLGYRSYRGSERDVLDRFHGAAREAGADVVVRITADCPLVDAGLVDQVIAARAEQGVEYASNTEPPTFPDGLDVEVFPVDVLERAWREAKAPGDREHVTPFIVRRAGAKIARVVHDPDLSEARWTVDEPEDLELVRRIFACFHPRLDFSWHDVIDLMAERPGIFAVNRHIGRNEGERMGSGQKLWNRALQVIAGGNMLLSKRPDMFLPGLWPTYFSRAKGCRIWDLDDREYVDMSLMGVGTNTLGYGHPAVDDAVRKAVSDGNMSTLNCPEEVWLAERLVAMHAWAGMVRFARTGGEANAVAVRIARAASGRDRVAFCGYHGWHDWYLAANVGQHERLAEHLLPGLAPVGVPSALGGTVLPFEYNRLDQLEALLSAYDDIGVIVMEPVRSMEPADGFLGAVRRLATERGIVLIFDERTAGFSETFGGAHLKYGIDPDMAIFGKALGNGYAITAVLGRRAVMEAAQDSFISSTFWTERIGVVAALATLDEMERVRSWEVITDAGRALSRGWMELAARHSLPIRVTGMPALATLVFARPDARACKTFLAQEMLRLGYLATPSVYSCIAHDASIQSGYFAALDQVFEALAAGDIEKRLAGPLCNEGFRRLT
jgi:glutamate-1-semialdehyde 2,1-aminomutase